MQTTTEEVEGEGKNMNVGKMQNDRLKWLEMIYTLK